MLDRQIRDTIRQFAQVGSIVGHAETSGHLQTLLREGKRIVITTVQKFPFILDAIGNEHRGRRFAIIIDEAHSSQGGRTSASVSMALGEAGAEEEDETTEDKINRLMESRKLLANASYFAFTATPKNKTLEIFGTSVPEGGNTRHVPFHSYTMKQAIQERFIIDVLKDYTPVNSYYRLVKTVEGDPEFDNKRAGKKLRRYVEDHDHAIRLKAEIMVDHFHEQVAGLQKIGGQARAMVVTSSIQRAITYFYAIRDYLAERKSPYQAIAAFSGEHEHDGAGVTESSLNGFSSQAQRALTQLVGRVMRQPHARRIGREALDQVLRLLLQYRRRSGGSAGQERIRARGPNRIGGRGAERFSRVPSDPASTARSVSEQGHISAACTSQRRFGLGRTRLSASHPTRHRLDCH